MNEREQMAMKLEGLASAEERVKQAKEVLVATGAYTHFIVETERLQLRLHYEVNRTRKRLEDMK